VLVLEAAAAGVAECVAALACECEKEEPVPIVALVPRVDGSRGASLEGAERVAGVVSCDHKCSSV
jgi:hypothetical protein